MTGRCRPLLAVVQKGTDAEQKRRKRISFLAEIEEPDSAKNAYHDHGYNFEHCLACQRRAGAVISNQARFKFGLEAIFTGEDVRLHSGTRVTFSASVRAVDQLAMIAAVAQTVGNSSYSDEGNRPLCVREHPRLQARARRQPSRRKKRSSISVLTVWSHCSARSALSR